MKQTELALPMPEGSTDWVKGMLEVWEEQEKIITLLLSGDKKNRAKALNLARELRRREMPLLKEACYRGMKYDS